MLTVRRNYVRANGEGYDKDTKSHQMRRLSIDEPTVDLLRAHQASCEQLLALLGLRLGDDHYVFSAVPDRSRPRDPSSTTRRYQRMVDRLGIDTHLHELRHYSATELLTAGVDLRTVAGRLGHGDGTTTLRHYAAWSAAADQQAASVVSARLPRPPGRDPRTLDAGEVMGVNAQRYTLRLYWRSSMLREEVTNLDPRDDAMLRATLERLVEAERGTLRLDLSEWSLVVHTVGGGQIRARVNVAPSGATEVKR